MEQGMKEKQEMKNYLETIRFLNEGTSDYFFIWDICGERIYFAGDLYHKYPLPFRGEEGNTVQDCKDLVYARDLALFERELLLIKNGEEEVCNMEYRIVDREGNREWINCRGKSKKGADGQPLWMMGRVSGSEILHKVDALTGIFNADKFMEDMQKCREQNHSGYLLIFGIDNFKSINIKYGRNYGNHILKRVAGILEEEVDFSMNIYRLDGDRFAVMLPQTARETVEELYKRVQKKLTEYCTVSAGAAFCNGDCAEDCGTIYQYAEASLDRAKAEGKNLLVFFSPEYYKKRLAIISLQEEMHRSVYDNCNGFYLCYQPLINSRTFCIWGCEALLRYESPSRGKMSPVEFIPLLEQTELICPVGEWVLKTALGQCKEWREWIPEFHINVNISYVQLRREGICGRVLEILEESGVPGEALTLEVTESMQLQDYEYFNKIFFQWKEAGIKIAIDDFGTGYSSLSYLKSIEIDEAKIDRCFVNRIQHSAYNYRLLNNMIELAHTAKIKVCCEGVETEEELMALKELSPDMFQGYLFAKPCAKETFENLYIREYCPEYAERIKKEEYFEGLDYGEDKKFLEILQKEELGTIVEGMDDVIYVSDIDTYELYYLNQSGRKLTGLYSYKGCKCYKVLFDRETPCESCTRFRQEGNDFHVREVENAFLNRHFIIKDKVMPWNGSMVRLEIATDVTTRELANRKIKEKLDFEKIIVKCSKKLVDEKDIETAIVKVLGAVGEYYQADRAYIFEPMKDKDCWSNTYEWCADGVNSLFGELDKVLEAMITHWLTFTQDNTSLLIADVSLLSDSFPELWEIMSRRGIHQVIATPIWKEDKLIGFVGINNAKHRQDDDALIRTMSYFLGERITREATKERLNELLDCQYEDILKNTNMGLWVIHIDKEHDKYELYTDKTMRRILGIEGDPGVEECYRHWYSRIKEECYSYVNRRVEVMIESGRVIRLEYSWNHPTEGEVRIRCVGVRGEDSDGKICLEGYHSMVDDREKFLE